MFILNKQVVEFKNFPNGEIMLDIRNIKIRPQNHLEWQWEDNADFIKLSILKDYLDIQFTKTDLYIKYMPYSRMDRANGIYAFSLKTVTNMINAMDFFSVTVREPHSDVTTALLNNVRVDPWVQRHIDYVLNRGDYDTIMFPDAGAQKRYQTTRVNNVVGVKTRNFETGNIESLEIVGTVGKSVLIVDDMCSRGGTFIQAAKKLRESGAEEVYLLVAYLEDNVRSGDLDLYIDCVYAGNKVAGYPTLIVLED